MPYLMSVLMGILQGIAEFLPISSSGHLALFQHFFGLENVEEKQLFFSVLLHFGTLISVCAVYWQDILEMIEEFFRGVTGLFSRETNRPVHVPPARRLVMLLILGTLPLFALLPVKDKIEELFTNITFVSCALIVTGFILFFSDRMSHGHKTAKSAKVSDALIVGIAQAIAVVPGISRSGATISTGMLCGYDRRFAVRFSFLLSLPAVLGATILELKDALEAGFDTSMLPAYLVGMATAAVVGFFAIHLVNALAKRGKFGKFAYYCWAVGLVTLIAGFLE